MIIYFIILLIGVSVTCFGNSNIEVEMPKHPPKHPPKTFNVYWNVPTFQCSSKKIHFENLYEKFGIIQNERDAYRGSKVALLYEDSINLFPTLSANKTTKQIKFINGGVPQEGNLKRHLADFEKWLNQSIPNEKFDGLGVIDMERWKPVYRQHFNTQQLNNNVSVAIERKLHAYSNWWWNTKWLESEAQFRFEEAARMYMQQSLQTAKKLRPLAKWGYYAYPYCYNMEGRHPWMENCSSTVQEENNNLGWLWRESTALYPSLYSNKDHSPSQLVQLIHGRVREAARFGTDILPYVSFFYRNSADFFKEIDLNALISTLYNSEATGFIIWGASQDVNTPEKCKDMLNYVEKVLGPAIAQYTKINSQGDISEELTTPIDYTYTVDNKFIEKNVATTTDLSSSLSHNNTQDIKNQLTEQITNKVTNDTKSENTVLENSVLGDLIRKSTETAEFINTNTKNLTSFSRVTTDTILIKETETLDVTEQNINPDTQQDGSVEKSKSVTLETFTREDFEFMNADGKLVQEKNTYNEYYNIQNKQNKGSEIDSH